MGAGPHLPPHGPQREGGFRPLWEQVGASPHGTSGDEWGLIRGSLGVHGDAMWGAIGASMVVFLH